MAACNSPNSSDESKSSDNLTRPNIILILADDMGFSDIGCYGSEIQTPNLDKLAQEGVLCTQFYNASRCCPTRASLMTGLYPHQAGMGHMSFGLTLQPEGKHIESYQGYPPENTPTIADILGGNGYSTMISGKWHIGDNPEHYPTKHGFQKGYFIPESGGPYFSTEHYTMKLHDGTKEIEYPDTTLYFTDLVTNNAMKMLEEAEKDKPFFLYLAYTAPHTPLQAPDSLIQKYMPVYKNGWTPIRKQRFENLKAKGLVPDAEKTGYAEDYAGVDFDWDKWSDYEKWFLQRTLATYAGMIDNMDQNIGRLLNYLETNKKLDNTVIFFFSDNGASHEKGGFWHKEDSSMVPGAKGYNGGPGPWGGRMSNTPFRLYKAYAHQGGISTSFIAYGTGYFPKNKILKEPYFHVMDMMPTCLELANASYPETFNGQPVKKTFHESMLSYLKMDNPDENTSTERVLCWEHQGHRGVRKGKWKLTFVREYYWHHPTTLEHHVEMINEWGLYNLEDDPFENNNLYDKYPEKVKELKKEYETWAEQTGVVDWEKVNIWK